MKNKIIYVIACLLLMVVCVETTYIIMNKDNNSGNNISGETSNDKENILIDGASFTTIKEYLTKLFNSNNDATVKKIVIDPNEEEIKTKFSNLDKSTQEDKIIINCNDYVDENYSGEDHGEEFLKENNHKCVYYIGKINDTIEYDGGVLNNFGCSSSTNVFKYNNYIITMVEDGCTSFIRLKIYDKNNAVIYSTTTAIANILKNDETVSVYPIIKNGLLYFVDVKIDSKNSVNHATVTTINLSDGKLTENQINKFDYNY